MARYKIVSAGFSNSDSSDHTVSIDVWDGTYASADEAQYAILERIDEWKREEDEEYKDEDNPGGECPDFEVDHFCNGECHVSVGGSYFATFKIFEIKEENE